MLASLLAAVLTCVQSLAPPEATPSIRREGSGSTLLGPANVLKNQGFEQGRAGWTHMAGNQAWGAFEVVSRPVRSGEGAAHLALRWPEGRQGQTVKVYGVVQEPSPSDFPELLSGWYRVEDWQKGDPRTDLYVQVVVIVMEDPRTSSIIGAGKLGSTINNYQVRYYLAGLAAPAFRLRNAKVVILDGAAPVSGQWQRFEIPLRSDFKRLWGVVPEGYAFLRVLFEARWDNKPEGTGVKADVYYDDLYLGPAGGRLPGARSPASSVAPPPPLR